ncbi:hypothetical protein KKC91_04280 [bacterium]|nr:hypothetical protein [bacterium]MBU1853260.1 hypothetical protein [Candidatus Omnitrophota bacterium]
MIKNTISISLLILIITISFINNPTYAVPESVKSTKMGTKKQVEQDYERERQFIEKRSLIEEVRGKINEEAEDTLQQQEAEPCPDPLFSPKFLGPFKDEPVHIPLSSEKD